MTTIRVVEYAGVELRALCDCTTNEDAVRIASALRFASMRTGEPNAHFGVVENEHLIWKTKP